LAATFGSYGIGASEAVVFNRDEGLTGRPHPERFCAKQRPSQASPSHPRRARSKPPAFALVSRKPRISRDDTPYAGRSRRLKAVFLYHLPRNQPSGKTAPNGDGGFWCKCSATPRTRSLPEVLNPSSIAHLHPPSYVQARIAGSPKPPQTEFQHHSPETRERGLRWGSFAICRSCLWALSFEGHDATRSRIPKHCRAYPATFPRS